jgi:hypothetical protein
MRDGGASTAIHVFVRGLEPDVAVRVLVARLLDGAGELLPVLLVVFAPPWWASRRERRGQGERRRARCGVVSWLAR